ncbi:LptF/LptG family permease [Kordiimonas marina]|uniref:LptF/LptG family permease n=1 Tax=Kordiimonas marina TaxID=2872312 RepID=UPI001FF4246B|nr:LptF/LptG family permease [Kordiimonas marina]MCJ9428834.1 LptF/LptG family permease [Kordiimonas marina]
MILERYISKQILVRISAVMALTVGLLLIENMLNLFRFVVQTSGPVSAVFSMLAYLVPEYMTIGVPISLLLGIMLVYQKLANDQELAAMNACRVSPWRLLRVPLMYGALFAVLNAVLVSYIEPYAEFKFAEFSFKTRSGAFGRSISTGEFTKLGPGITLMVQSVDRKTGALDDVFLEVLDKKGSITYATAAKGNFYQSSDADKLVFRLRDGLILTTAIDPAAPETIGFDQYDILVPLPDIPGFRHRGGQENELTLRELIHFSDSTKTVPEKRQAYSGEAQRRIIWFLVPLFIPFLAIALAVPPPRKRSPMGIVVGIALIILLIKLLDFGANIEGTAPGLILWPVFFGFAGLSLRLFYVFGFTSGRHPLSIMFRLSDWTAKKVRWLRGKAR